MAGKSFENKTNASFSTNGRSDLHGLSIFDITTNASSTGSLAWYDRNYYSYGTVMFFILTLGFLGNVLTIIVFLQREQRTKVIAPFVINLAVADLFIVLFGYPVAITANLSGMKLVSGESRCTWSAFVNGATGIASIAMLTEISVLMCYTITSVKPVVTRKDKFLSRKFTVSVLVGAWIYGILSMSPPLLGWSRFVPGSAGISCGPEWGSSTIEALTYSIGLMFIGFFLPMTIILVSFYRIYRFLSQSNVPTNLGILQSRHHQSQMKIVHMIIMTIVAFVISWSPYCAVSLGAMFRRGHVLAHGEAEIPELLAKSSVIYNPIIYMTMSKNFRKTVKRTIFQSLSGCSRSLVRPSVCSLQPRAHRDRKEFV
ncbi:melanopsin-like isoform X2 [Actinia tenebrosa]|nr:melanopsin-like isoform X2 [Actinia tenebrosa]XP_031572522.1 melanopsin-like isoform X2 [Actinia tenebrosa]